MIILLVGAFGGDATAAFQHVFRRDDQRHAKAVRFASDGKRTR
jgi:hypothetical protein